MLMLPKVHSAMFLSSTARWVFYLTNPLNHDIRLRIEHNHLTGLVEDISIHTNDQYMIRLSPDNISTFGK